MRPPVFNGIQGGAAVAHAQLRPPTMADVAQLAGVSHQTVSRVLGDHPNVRDETRTKVLHAIKELGYRRNSSARALATRRTRTLGVVASNTTLFEWPVRCSRSRRPHVPRGISFRR